MIMFEELKPLMNHGERYIVVEGGRPEYVVMRFPDYVALMTSTRTGAAAPSSSIRIERDPFASVNVELEEVTAGRAPSGLPSRGFESEASPADPTTVRLEDLPL